MGIILKHTFKNIFSKPGRTILLTLCIFMCSFAATMCIDISGSVERLITYALTDMVGSTDIMVSSDEPLPDDFEELFVDARVLPLYSSVMPLYRRDPQLYSYAINDDLYIYAFDLRRAYDMKLLLTELELSPTEAALTEDIAELYGYSEGDTINLYDLLGDKVEFTIAKIVKKGGILRSGTCVISADAVSRICSDEVSPFNVVYIDILNDKYINSTYDNLKENYPDMEILNVKNNEDAQKSIDNITSLFVTIFAVCLIVAVIITITVSERIMSERIPVVGTLRSLGVSSRKTTFILLLENVIYALIGSIPAVILYSVARLPLLESLFTVEGEVAADFGSPSVFLYIGTIAGAIVIECLCTLKETIRVNRIAIRDVIFQGSNADYRFSTPKTIIGGVCLVLAVVLAFFKSSFIMLIMSFVCGVVGMYLLFSYSIFRKGTQQIFQQYQYACCKYCRLSDSSKKKHNCKYIAYSNCCRRYDCTFGFLRFNVGSHEP